MNLYYHTTTFPKTRYFVNVALGRFVSQLLNFVLDLTRKIYESLIIGHIVRIQWPKRFEYTCKACIGLLDETNTNRKKVK